MDYNIDLLVMFSNGTRVTATARFRQSMPSRGLLAQETPAEEPVVVVQRINDDAIFDHHAEPVLPSGNTANTLLTGKYLVKTPTRWLSSPGSRHD
jgi:hypothetical protein